ncbi:hypothetical protein [Oceanobacillus sojae]|uniref:hypothetical protein n=1 Tax=Oceanobacillus sojae TaxID=582851 RepID=UPI0036322479
MTTILTGAEAVASLTDPVSYAEEFARMLDEYHRKPEVYDDQLSADFYRLVAEMIEESKPPRFEGLPYFSPSSANACPRSLYLKLKRAKKDSRKVQPHQSRWQKHGTAIGESLQKDLFFIEKHFADAPFKFKRTRNGYPAFEEAAQACVTVEASDSNGEIRKFKLFGKPDGILDHTSGATVGLEIKSKQTTAAQTGHYKMREPKEDHRLQCVTYSAMYGINDFIITYVNASKKGWFLDEETYAKNPDVRAFDVKVTDSDRQALLEKFADLLRRVDENDPPKLDLEKWTFNNFKEVSAIDLSEEEVAELQAEVKAVEASSAYQFVKQNYRQAIEEILELRGA